MDHKPYNLNRPAHLIAGQVIRDIEALQMVKYGPQHSAPIHRLVEQYQELLFQQGQTPAHATPARKQDIDTDFPATLRRVTAARDVIEADEPAERENRYRFLNQAKLQRLTLEEAVSLGIELTGDETRAHHHLILVNEYIEIIAIFYDGRAFVPNELLDVKGEGL